MGSASYARVNSFTNLTRVLTRTPRQRLFQPVITPEDFLT
jgi:hypothetical protein